MDLVQSENIVKQVGDGLFLTDDGSGLTLTDGKLALRGDFT